jgi:hypothetical protein
MPEKKAVAVDNARKQETAIRSEPSNVPNLVCGVAQKRSAWLR